RIERLAAFLNMPSDGGAVTDAVLIMVQSSLIESGVPSFRQQGIFIPHCKHAHATPDCRRTEIEKNAARAKLWLRGGSMENANPGTTPQTPAATTPTPTAAAPAPAATPASPGDGSVATSDEMRDALKEVFDPEIPINIVDLGLIYKLEPKEA